MIKGINLDYNKYKQQNSQHSNYNVSHHVLLTNNSFMTYEQQTKEKTMEGLRLK